MDLNRSPQQSLLYDNLYSESNLIEDLDNVRYICVDPHEVNPICEKDSGLRTPIPEIQPKKETLQRTDCQLGGHGFCVPDQKVKLEMEEFSDLSTFLLQKPLSANSLDELNTPVFIKDAFDFDLFSTFKESCSGQQRKVKQENDAYCEGLSPTEKSIDFSPHISNRMHQNENIITTSGVTNVHLHPQQCNLQQQQMYSNLYTRGSENDSAYTYKISPPSSVDTACAVSVGNSDRHYSNASSPDPQSFSRLSNRGIMTPEDSDCSVAEEKPILRLNVNMRPKQNNVNLDTPVIIEEVVDLESATNFNILDLVNNEDLSYLDTSGIFSNPSVSTVTLPSVSETAVSIAQKQAFPSEKRIRKRKNYDDDDDEDYIPPSKQSSSRRRSKYSETDTDSEEESRPRGRPRGRPPKRAESVSSDNDVSKYRELRDKNNEASRRSRLKRKYKELELEKEAEELNSKNIKLKAQVEELEKMVTNFRDNLFKIMIKK